MLKSLDEQEVEHVMSLPKRIEEDIHWERSTGLLQFEVRVANEEGYDLRLKGVLTEATRALRYNLFLGSQPIRMLHLGKPHHNPNCSVVGRNHKHHWTDSDREHLAHEPSDVDFSTARSALSGFLRECKIEFDRFFESPTLQQRLFRP